MSPSSDRPSKATLLARLLIAVTLIAGLAGAVTIAVDWEPRLLPVRVVSIDGELRSLSREALQQTVASHIRGGILTLDLPSLHDEVESLAWVESARLRRVWPDRIELTVVEHQAEARWGQDGLVSASGHVFRPEDGRLPAGLPLLSGPRDQDAPLVVERFRDWSPKLAGLGLIVDGIHRGARGDWTVELLGGTQLLFGTEQIETRFQRLLVAYGRIEALGIPSLLDLRYSNGLAVRWIASDGGGRSERLAATR
jgi:cell division protein FtsQ